MWMAVLLLEYWQAHICISDEDSKMSFLDKHIAALVIILWSTLPTPIGLTTRHLSEGISQYSDHASKDFSKIIKSQSFCVIAATDFSIHQSPHQIEPPVANTTVMVLM